MSSTFSAVTPTESERNAWDQLPEEPSKAFHAFTVYRDLGWDRSVKKVVLEGKKAKSMIYRWSLSWTMAFILFAVLN